MIRSKQISLSFWMKCRSCFLSASFVCCPASWTGHLFVPPSFFPLNRSERFASYQYPVFVVWLPVLSVPIPCLNICCHPKPSPICRSAGHVACALRSLCICIVHDFRLKVRSMDESDTVYDPPFEFDKVLMFLYFDICCCCCCCLLLLCPPFKNGRGIVRIDSIRTISFFWWNQCDFHCSSIW